MTLFLTECRMESSHPLATPPATRETHDCGIRRKLSVHIGVPPESSPPGGTRGAAGPAAAEAGREAINDYFLAGQVAVTLNGQCCCLGSQPTNCIPWPTTNRRNEAVESAITSSGSAVSIYESQASSSSHDSERSSRTHETCRCRSTSRYFSEASCSDSKDMKRHVR